MTPTPEAAAKAIEVVNAWDPMKFTSNVRLQDLIALALTEQAREIEQLRLLLAREKVND